MKAAGVPATRTRDPQRTRNAIVDALLEALAAGDGAITSKGLAQRAGVSERSIFVHFSDLDDLRAAAAHAQHERITDALAPIESRLPLDVRIELLVRQRESIYPLQAVRLAALHFARTSESLADQMAETDLALRSQVRTVLGDSLRTESGRRDTQLAAIVEMLLSWGARYHLCEVIGMSPKAASRSTVRSLTALLV